ncbi:Alpha/beta hydrolase family-domain-containing protein [Mycena maculata]|uniref:Alpha/beta hydrolase family-domain-containing protein n=1 Tax=Mycena maculata TaxID=230809 RepID=A0AAD7HNH8_9AGAR|nr:Alpha/beta hydrolase family-domain-containing protein [Mycena maculata]
MSTYSPPVYPRSATRDSYPPLLPIYPPPVSAYPNPFPTPPQPLPFPNPRYAVSTHLVPAAHLRCTPLAPPPPGPAPASASKEERRARNAERGAWVEQQAQAPRGRHERVLWSAVNRYVHRDPGASATGTTLFLAHANGFPKETWEPALLDLLTSPAGGAVDEIWAWEATHHGASCVLNLNVLNTPLSACDWSDDARDVLNFLLHFLPSSVAPDALPAVLPRVAPEESALRKVRGFPERRLLAAGHSFGGCSCTWAALTHPRLFTALTLVDPVLVRFGPAINPKDPNGPALIGGAISRRDSWASREEAAASFAASPFFAAWDPRVLAAYVAHGLTPVSASSSAVRLAMPPLQEALVFAGTPTSGRAWDMLPGLDARIPLRWVVPGKAGEPEIGGPGGTQERVWRRPANASNVRIAEAGHLIVQQAPHEIAREVGRMVEASVADWGPPTAKL